MPHDVTSSTPARRAARALHPTSEGIGALDSEVLTAIVEGLAATVGPQSPVPVGVVRRCRLLDTEGYDAWLMVWGPNASAEIHDHDGSVSAMHIVHGVLRETVADIGSDRAVTTLHAAGSTASTSATDTHRLANGASHVTVSVHAYSPPLGERSET
jgi:hypothetical protein